MYNLILNQNQQHDPAERRDFFIHSWCIFEDMTYMCIYAFDNYIPAHLALGRLEQAGINAWLKDEHTVTIDPLLTNALGGIKLMVHPAQAERARTLMDDWEKTATQKTI